MYEKKWYELAMVELQSLARQFPEDEKVAALRTLVQSKIDDQQKDTRSDTRPSPTGSNNNPVTEVTDTPSPDQRLTEEQISTIRVYEVDLAQEPRSLSRRKPLTRLYEAYASNDQLTKDRRAFKRMPGYEQLQVLFNLQARELYPEVIIRQDSPAIKEFRSQLHQRYVLNYCGATGCHGDGSPGGLYLFRILPNSDATVYTNFYILNRIHNAQGAMIDRDEPRRSLLLQYGIKREGLRHAAPGGRGLATAIQRRPGPRFLQYADVINMLWQPAPEYGISYSPPVWRAETEQDKPAEQPAP